MSTVTTSPDVTVERDPSRMTSTLMRTTAPACVLAAAATTCSAGVLRVPESPWLCTARSH